LMSAAEAEELLASQQAKSQTAIATRIQASCVKNNRARMTKVYLPQLFALSRL
jgi:hypothetical protein